MTSRTSPGCESVRTRYDLSRTTGQGALIWSAIRVRHRPRAMHHKLAWLLYFSSAPLFPFVPVTRWSLLLFADQLLFVFVLTGPRAKKTLSHLSFRVCSTLSFVPIFQSIFRISRNSRELSWKRKEAKEFPWKNFAISSSIWYNNGIIILFLIDKFNRWIYNNKYMYIGSWLVSKIFLNKYEETLTYVFLRDKNVN